VRRIIRLKLAYALGVNGSPEPLPQKQAHLQLAAQAGRAAVQLLQDEASWLPLALPSGRLLVVSPSDIDAGDVEGNGLSLLGELLVARGLDVVEQFYLPEAPWSVAQVQSEALSLAPAVDGIVVLTSNAILRYAHFQETAQETLVRELLDRSGLPTIVVFSQLPYDQQRMPQAPTQIATFGATAGQLEGLAALLMGD
jgi:beta-glucosidase-like glycosyl hydrolase